MLSLVFTSVFLVGFNQCSGGPKVTVYISNPNAGGMDFADTDHNRGFLEYPRTDKFVCFSSPDAETLLNYCGVSKKTVERFLEQ